MSRLENFRKERRHKRIFKALLLSFFVFLSLGMLSADYSLNSMKKAQGEISMVRVIKSGQYVEMSFLNNKLYLNTTYLERDMSNVKKYLMSVFGHGKGLL